MDSQKLVHGLYFHENLASHDQISAVSAIKFYSFVAERERLLAFERQVAQAQFAAETNLVGRFKQTRAELTMNFDCAANHDFGNFISILDSLCALRGLCG